MIRRDITLCSNTHSWSSAVCGDAGGTCGTDLDSNRQHGGAAAPPLLVRTAAALAGGGTTATATMRHWQCSTICCLMHWSSVLVKYAGLVYCFMCWSCGALLSGVGLCAGWGDAHLRQQKFHVQCSGDAVVLKWSWSGGVLAYHHD
jgi:hypothetical protein